MAVIPFPTNVGIKRIQWTPPDPIVQVNRSGWTNHRQVVQQPGSPMWMASFELAPIIGEINVRAWRAFRAKLLGPINTFRLVATETNQHPHGEGKVATNFHGVLGRVLRSTGWPGGAAPTLFAGQMFTINDELKILTQDAVDLGGGGRDLYFEPALRKPLENGTPIVTVRPACLVSRTPGGAGWSVDPGQMYGISYEVEEAFAP